MDVLSHYNSRVIEFPATQPLEKQYALVDNCTGTDPPPPSKDAGTGTQKKQSMATQTEQVWSRDKDVEYDERALAKFLRNMYPTVERELMNPTPQIEEQEMNQSRLEEELRVFAYQKISIEATMENSTGLAIWLSVHTNNVPVLVVTTVAPHDDWCEHTDQQLKLFVPKRMFHSNLVLFEEPQVVRLKSCLRSLSTNNFNKNIFAGSTMDGDLLVWLYEPVRSVHTGDASVDIKQLYSYPSTQGPAVAIDWPQEHLLLACYSNGTVRQWDLSKHMYLDWEYSLPASVTSEPTAMVALSQDEFVLGTNDGGVYRCWSTGRQVSASKTIQIYVLNRHRFTVSTLLKTEMEGSPYVLSCDLSGQAYYHDMRLAEEVCILRLRNFKNLRLFLKNPQDKDPVVIQIPLPFKNAIACGKNGGIIFAPSNDGALEYYRTSNGANGHVKGSLRGKGSFIRCSENGRWIVTGFYGNDFQVFQAEL
ncbi:hypothetical protein KR074_004986 [Drosophila pseudoananassae]|nr:hypothetical protein KR074_004986 [Drosophila pseudoananassae]